MTAQHFTSLSEPEIVELLSDGKIGVIPTDTVYGLVAQAANEKAIQKLYRAKQRELPPGTMIGATTKSFANLGFNPIQLDRVAHYWPASLSVVLDAANVPAYLRPGRETLPVRIPAAPSVASLLHQTGPLMTTSANAPGQPTSTSVQMAVNYFGDEVDFYVDGGDLSGRPPSTIIGFNAEGAIVVYRQGAVTIET